MIRIDRVHCHRRHFGFVLVRDYLPLLNLESLAIDLVLGIVPLDSVAAVSVHAFPTTDFCLRLSL